jgi:hypothetical protein
MDWSNEPYVRVYTRETDDELALSWEAMAVWNQLMKRFDRSGFVETRRGARGLAAITRIPLEVVERVLPEILEDGRLVAVDGGFVAPNFIAAQEATKSDRQRQKDSRDRRRAQALDVTNRDESITIRDANVTPGHAESQPVTLTSALPSVADQEVHSPARAIVRTTTWQQQKAWWDCMLAAHNRLRAKGIKPNTPDLASHPNEQALAACARFLREGGYDEAGVDAKMRHVVAVMELEADALGHLDFFKPAILWGTTRADRFPRKVDTSLEEAARAAAPRGRVGPQPVTKAARGAIGASTVHANYGSDSKPAREVL